jgi:hypothetical protein
MIGLVCKCADMLHENALRFGIALRPESDVTDYSSYAQPLTCMIATSKDYVTIGVKNALVGEQGASTPLVAAFPGFCVQIHDRL